MATFRQVSRGIMQAARAAERENRRIQRQQLIQQQMSAKEALLDASARAAGQYDSLIKFLTQGHQISFKRTDWNAKAKTRTPNMPVLGSEHETAAQSRLAAYIPSWFDRAFRLEKGKKSKLLLALTYAQQRDAVEHQAACERIALQSKKREFAQRIIAFDPDALITAIQERAHLDDIAADGLRVSIIEGSRLVVVLDAYEQDDMPHQSVSLLQSGKASHRQVSPPKINELHRDNVCSASIRTATEILSVLPIDSVEILALIDLLDRATGHIEPQPVLYLRITAQALQTINLQQADAAPLAERLGVHLDWSRKEGFRPITLHSFDLPHSLLDT